MISALTGLVASYFISNIKQKYGIYSFVFMLAICNLAGVANAAPYDTSPIKEYIYNPYGTLLYFDTLNEAVNAALLTRCKSPYPNEIWLNCQITSSAQSASIWTATFSYNIKYTSSGYITGSITGSLSGNVAYRCDGDFGLNTANSLGWAPYVNHTQTTIPLICRPYPSSVPGPTKNLGGPTNNCASNSDTSTRPSALYTKYPINLTQGNKYYAMPVYNFNQISYSLFYNVTASVKSAQHGLQWRNSYNKSINTTDPSVAIVFLSDGKTVSFFFDGISWKGNADITDQLIESKDAGGVRTGWQYVVSSDNSNETYDVSGKLLSIADRSGLTQTMTYSDASTPTSIAPAGGLLIRVTDALGRQLNFTYDSLGRVVTMTNPAGKVYTYGYGSDNNLVSVTYPDSKVRTYHYENTTFKNALTGITDENNSRYMTYSYDSNRRAYLEVSPNVGTNVNRHQLSYTPGVSTTVTDPLGSVRTYNFTTILGVSKLTGQSQPAGSGCAASASALTYDANGNVASRTDFNGNKTTYVYDLTRNLETSRTEGLTAAGSAIAGVTRTVTTSWHATWRLPLVISEYNGNTATGTPLKTTTYTYDAKGNLASYTVTDPALSITRTTTITNTYSTVVPGLLLTKVVDGPRNDVSDITTYTYYPHDATCTASTGTSTVTNLGCRGQLQSVTNALGQATQYTRYNHHGQLEESIDPNGLVTTNTYDVRQRLTSNTVGTETTSLTYDGVGQVTLLTLPDNSTLSYTYDAAHRLTDVQDTLGNKVHYTLDAEGNRIGEDTYDPSSLLTKTLTRSYDALNRLQQLNGIE